MDAPGRRGRFAAAAAKSNDDARAVGASNGIVSLVLFSLAPSATLSFHKENSVIAEGLVLLSVLFLYFSTGGKVLAENAFPTVLRQCVFASISAGSHLLKRIFCAP